MLRGMNAAQCAAYHAQLCDSIIVNAHLRVVPTLVLCFLFREHWFVELLPWRSIIAA